MDTAAYARADCEVCAGRGRVRTGERLNDIAICTCVLAHQQLLAARHIIHTHIGARGKDMTLDRYQTGGVAGNEKALGVARNFVTYYAQAAREGWLLTFWGRRGAGSASRQVGRRGNARWSIWRGPASGTSDRASPRARALQPGRPRSFPGHAGDGGGAARPRRPRRRVPPRGRGQRGRGELAVRDPLRHPRRAHHGLPSDTRDKQLWSRGATPASQHPGGNAVLSRIERAAAAPPSSSCREGGGGA